MAQGDVQEFDQFHHNLGLALHNLSTSTYKLALITSAVTPASTTADPRWGAGGSTNLSTNEVTAGGNYTSGGVTLSSVTYTLTGGKSVWDAADITISQNASNPTNARWGIIYDNTDAGKRAVAYLDLGSTFDMTTGDLVIAWNAGGILDLD